MKRGTPDHPKTLRLQRALKASKVVACGYLELLFHWTAKYAPQGDVGRFTDDDIAAGVGWDGEPADFVAAFVAAGYIDRDTGHRLIVHDWHEHADDATKKALTRKGLECVKPTAAEVATPADDGGRRPDMSRLPVPLPVPLPLPGNPPPNPRPEGGGLSKSAAASAADRLAAKARELLGRGVPDALVRSWRKELRRGVAEADILQRLEGEAAAIAEAAREQREFQEGRRAAAEFVEQRGGPDAFADALVGWIARNARPDETETEALERWRREELDIPAALRSDPTLGPLGFSRTVAIASRAKAQRLEAAAGALGARFESRPGGVEMVVADAGGEVVRVGPKPGAAA